MLADKFIGRTSPGRVRFQNESLSADQPRAVANPRSDVGLGTILRNNIAISRLVVTRGASQKEIGHEPNDNLHHKLGCSHFGSTLRIRSAAVGK
jgi:hypothetical protein